LPGRPRRRPDADAMVAGSQRRVFKSRLRAVVFPDEYGPGLWISNGQRRGAAAPFHISAPLDAPVDSVAKKAPVLRPWVARIFTPREQEGPGLHTDLCGRNRALYIQPVEVVATRATRFEQVPGNDPGRFAIPFGVPSH